MYQRRVRGRKFLWGGAGLARDAAFSRAVMLHVSNDEFGEDLVVGTRKADGTEEVLGTLAPGECVTLELGGAAGVYGEAVLDTLVTCAIAIA